MGKCWRISIWRLGVSVTTYLQNLLWSYYIYWSKPIWSFFNLANLRHRSTLGLCVICIASNLCLTIRTWHKKPVCKLFDGYSKTPHSHTEQATTCQIEVEKNSQNNEVFPYLVHFPRVVKSMKEICFTQKDFANVVRRNRNGFLVLVSSYIALLSNWRIQIYICLNLNLIYSK